MISKARIQFVKSLQQKKFREQHGQFVVEGPKVVGELLASVFKTEMIFACRDWLKINSKKLSKNIDVNVVSGAELQRISALKTASQVLAVAAIPEHSKFVAKDLKGFILALDGIGDPGNMGTILRTADWFGVDAVVCSENSVEIYNPKVVQATMGSLFRVRVFYEDLPEWLAGCKNDKKIYGTFLDGANIYKQKFDDSGIFIIGSESHGVSAAVEKLVSQRIHIPAASHTAESLNASVATGIVCSEVRRERLK